MEWRNNGNLRIHLFPTFRTNDLGSVMMPDGSVFKITGDKPLDKILKAAFPTEFNKSTPPKEMLESDVRPDTKSKLTVALPRLFSL